MRGCSKSTARILLLPRPVFTRCRRAPRQRRHPRLACLLGELQGPVANYVLQVHRHARADERVHHLTMPWCNTVCEKPSVNRKSGSARLGKGAWWCVLRRHWPRGVRREERCCTVTMLIYCNQLLQILKESIKTPFFTDGVRLIDLPCQSYPISLGWARASFTSLVGTCSPSDHPSLS
jgi:hypothetical protein